jgi:hypothetical protein
MTALSSDWEAWRMFAYALLATRRCLLLTCRASPGTSDFDPMLTIVSRLYKISAERCDRHVPSTGTSGGPGHQQKSREVEQARYDQQIVVANSQRCIFQTTADDRSQ